LQTGITDAPVRDGDRLVGDVTTADGEGAVGAQAASVARVMRPARRREVGPISAQAEWGVPPRRRQATVRWESDRVAPE
jgi:CBS domain-containing protein